LSAFSASSRYYDQFYTDKDYAGEELLAATGTSLVTSLAWITDRAPGPHTWSACFVERE